MSKVIILEKLNKLKFHFENGDIPALHNHEVNPGLEKGSRENYLYFILTCSLNFQRISPKTWESALKTWEDPKTNFVFFPEKVIHATEQDLRIALMKHKLALQQNKHIQIWLKIQTTFHKYFQDDPRKLFENGDFDSEKILNIVQKEMKKDFPYLSGPKLSNYFLFILLAYSDIKLKNIHLISIIPDTHIMQSTSILGILDKENVTPESTEKVWKELLQGTDFSPIDFHSILWNWSRNKFEPKV